MIGPSCRESRGAGTLAIVVPVLDDADALGALLARLRALDLDLSDVVVVDGGSRDGSDDVAAGAGAQLVRSRAGRGFQLAAGAASVRADWIWMLHADSAPSAAAVAYLRGRSAGAPGWGRFSIAFDADGAMAVIAFMMNARSCLTGICTGDQGIFVHRALLHRAGGVPAQSLMEDVELSRRLKRLARPECRRERVGTSARRWQSRGTARTVVAMWRFRLRYWRGADPERLAREYYRSCTTRWRALGRCRGCASSPVFPCAGWSRRAWPSSSASRGPWRLT